MEMRIHRIAVLVVAILLATAVSAFAQTPANPTFAGGQWEYQGQRLYQNDTDAGIAKAYIPYPQDGIVEYVFNARYEDGGQDGHWGFGIQLFVDEAIEDTAWWGDGDSWLLWLNYDNDPQPSTFPAGFTAQIYRSTANTEMELVQYFDLTDDLLPLPVTEDAQVINFRIRVNSETGEARFYDPQDPDRYWPIEIPMDEPLEGDYIVLRTNSTAISWGFGAGM